MFQIQRLSDYAKQAQTVFLPDGTSFYIELTFKPLQTAWFFDLTYGDRAIRGQRLVTSPNCLRHYHNLLPFGIACFSNSDRDPLFQKDFISGDIELYVLTQAEVAAFEEWLANA